MSAPALVPAEQAEVSRFGIHDEDILRDLAEHADDPIPCIIGGEASPKRIIVRCCGAYFTMCDQHAAEHRALWAGEVRRRGVICHYCKHDWPPCKYEDVIRVVGL